MMKRTPWFPPEVKPVRVGWYEAILFPGLHNDDTLPEPRFWWDGKEWRLARNGSALALQQRIWRGLTKPATLSRAAGE